MGSELLFEEVQDSGNKATRDFFRILAGIFVFALAFNLFLQKGHISNFSKLLATGFMICALLSLFLYSRLITQIRSDGIYVRFPPFQPSFSRYEWKDILDIHLRHFDALSEYHGWGIRTGPFGKAYMLPGKSGIQIIFHDKSRLLISTNRPEEITLILDKMGRL